MVNPREMPVDIVLDCDDILWPFVGRIVQELGVDVSIWTEFYATRNSHWSPELIARANELLMDSDVYRDIQFDTGIKDILRPEELGARVLINSNSPSAEVNELKTEQLLAAVPGLKPENLQFNIIEVNSVSNKTLGPQTLIFIDDNPYHIAASTAPINVMRRWPWNTSNSAKQVLASKRRVIMFDSLSDINRFIYYRTKIFLRNKV